MAKVLNKLTLNSISYLGYVHITDLGIAKKIEKENGSDTSGTPGYMAPEVLCR